MSSHKPFYIFLITVIILQLTKAEFVTKVQNIFQKSFNIHQGDFMVCEVARTNIREIKNDLYVYTAENRDSFSPNQYQFHPVSKKCFSFKVRAAFSAHIAISSTPSITADQRLEVILEHDHPDNRYSTIREITDTTVYLSKYEESGLINEVEYYGFWIRMLDDQLLEVGREYETTAFLYYRFANNRQLNYFAVMSVNTKGAWIFNGDSKCPGRNSTELKKTAESDCFLLHRNH